MSSMFYGHPCATTSRAMKRVCEAYQKLPMEKREEFANLAEKIADAASAVNKILKTGEKIA